VTSVTNGRPLTVVVESEARTARGAAAKPVGVAGRKALTGDTLASPVLIFPALALAAASLGCPVGCDPVQV
jgi:hypothetical protein